MITLKNLELPTSLGMAVIDVSQRKNKMGYNSPPSEDAYFALQNTNDEETWTVWQMPEYGKWIEKEIVMFLRVTTELYIKRTELI